ncbi:polysaccharide deacetylase [[Clostridium] cellulosi]|jgi:Polysaccharide deacetylase.|uniref:Polysaccharide deacetylase n=1 Tax=[Clostridium] cellulosi TaxID=29343 RepID=A0A078KV69_9FIRM|nr:MAG: deacetylase [[Clostridium] cellulosi]CDZ25029.1 polysaccharide deacetylase [[Clostridium] cellulosi]
MKVIIVKKKSLIAGALIICFAIVFIAAVTRLIPAAAEAVAAQSRKLPIYSVDKNEKVVSLTFDAAWGNEDTQTLIDILNKYKVHATFFVVGQWVDKYPESVKALSDAGNEVMNHSNTHPHMPNLSRAEMINQINACDEKIEKITGKRPILFRAPFGDYNNALIETVSEINHYCIQWDVDSLDWRGYDAETIKNRVLKNVRPGSIVLFHNAALHTPEALPGIIESLQQQGYKIVPVSELIYKDNYTIDVAGRQHSNNAPSSGAPSSRPIPVKPTTYPY